jgi:hypothetical protein
MLQISFYFPGRLKSKCCAERTFVFVADEKTRSVTESVQVLKGGKEQESAQCALSTEYHRHQVDEDEMSSG